MAQEVMIVQSVYVDDYYAKLTRTLRVECCDGDVVTHGMPVYASLCGDCVSFDLGAEGIDEG